MNSSTAAPPRIAKIGAPTTAATIDDHQPRPVQAGARARPGNRTSATPDQRSPAPRDRPSPPRPVGAPGKTQRNQREPHRQRELSHPRRNVRGDDRARLALGDDELDGAAGEDRRHAGRDRRGEHCGAPAAPAGHGRAGRERQKFALARGDRGAKEADPECEVLNERTGAGDADAEQPAHGDFEQRQRDHRGERQGGDPVLDRREQPDHFAGPVRCCLR